MITVFTFDLVILPARLGYFVWDLFILFEKCQGEQKELIVHWTGLSGFTEEYLALMLMLLLRCRAEEGEGEGSPGESRGVKRTEGKMVGQHLWYQFYGVGQWWWWWWWWWEFHQTDIVLSAEWRQVQRRQDRPGTPLLTQMVSLFSPGSWGSELKNLLNSLWIKRGLGWWGSEWGSEGGSEGGREASPPSTTTVKVTEQVKLAGITISIISIVKTGGF